MPKKILEVLEEPIIDDIPDSELEEEEPQTIKKSRSPRTDKQKEAFAKIIEKSTQARQARAEAREEAIIVKAEIEKKILKKGGEHYKEANKKANSTRRFIN